MTAGGRRRLTRLRRAPRRRGAIDLPAKGEVVPPGRVRLLGWSLAPRRPVGRVEIQVGEGRPELARPYAMARPDVGRLRSDATAPLAGFEHMVTIAGAPGTRVPIVATVDDIEGRRVTTIESEIVVGDAADAGSMTIASFPDLRGRDAPVPLRVFVFTHQLDLGGGQLYLQDVLRVLARDPAFSCTVVSGKAGALRSELEALGVDVLVIDYPVRSVEEYEARLRTFEVLFRTLGADVVLVNTVTAAIGADAALRAGIPVAWAIHESYLVDDYWTAAYGAKGIAPSVKRAIEHALARAPVVLFEADATRRVYLPSVPTEHSATLRYGIDAAAIRAYCGAHTRDDARREVGIDPRATVLLSLGTFEPRKAQGALAIAFSQIASDHPDTVLALVGDIPSDYAAGVRELIDRLPDRDRIIVRGVVDDPYPWYRAADAFVLGSDVESLPRTLLEVMAFGVPVVAADVWGIPELVRDGENGLLFAARDVGAVRDALARVLSMPAAERHALGAAGARTVEADHDAAGYIDAYRRLLPALVAAPESAIEIVRG